MSLLTDFLSDQYDFVDFGLLYVVISALSLLADNYLGGYTVAQWWFIVIVGTLLFVAKQSRNKKSNK